MLLEIDNFEQFKIFFDAICDITEYIQLELFQTHMRCSILDKSHARFMEVEYQADFFSLYEVDDIESVTLYSEDVLKIIKSVNKIDTVILQTNDEYLICKVESKNGNSRVFEFVLPVESTESRQPPSLTLPIKFNLSIDDLRQGIKDLKILGTSEIKFIANEDKLIITAGTEITTNYSYTIPMDYNISDVQSANYTLEYIEQLLRFVKISKEGTFEMGDNYPLLYTFEDDVMGVKIKGLIAPRIEVD